MDVSRLLRMSVGGELGGCQRVGLRRVRSVGVGRNPCRFSDTDVVTPSGAIFLLQGRRVYSVSAPLCVPGEILGYVRATASSSSPPFLKVLLGTRQSGGFGMRWNSLERVQQLRLIFVFVDLVSLSLFSLLFLLFFFLGLRVLFAQQWSHNGVWWWLFYL